MPPKPVAKKPPKPAEKKAPGAPVIQPDSDSEEEVDYNDVFDEDGVPLGQLKLTEEELNKDVSIILKTDNPYMTEELVEFSFKTLDFIPLSSYSDTIKYFSQGSSIIRKSSQDALGVIYGAEEEGKKKRRNKFNFCDRAVQTPILASREQSIQTAPPAEAKLAFNATLTDMTDAFTGTGDSLLQATFSFQKGEKKEVKKVFGEDESWKKDENVRRAFIVFYRMVNQNRALDIMIDFSFYDNPCDEFMEQGLGSLLPLWKFSFRPMKGFNVTSICWNYTYPDMFAVGFGSVQFLSDEQGCVCIFTLKSTHLPEKVYFGDSSVHCLDFNKEAPYLLAAGFRDGRVAVYDYRCTENLPLATSECCEIHHNDIVNQVRWLSENVDKQHNFCSVCADGRVINWSLAKSELIPHIVITTSNPSCKTIGPEGAHLDAVSCATCISFKDDSTDIFLVGTEEGMIHKCSGLYAHEYLSTYKEHSSILYNVEWNPFHPKVFLSCSADWTIRIWDHESPKSVFIFDMFNEVKAAVWAPFSSTVFAGITKDGKVHVFDLMNNRQQPTCSYVVNPANKGIMLVTVAFNPKLPVVMVGDDRGYVISLKLSPNLRSSLKAINVLEESKYKANEIDKMDKVLKLAKGPDSKETRHTR